MLKQKRQIFSNHIGHNNKLSNNQDGLLQICYFFLKLLFYLVDIQFFFFLQEGNWQIFCVLSSYF